MRLLLVVLLLLVAGAPGTAQDAPLVQATLDEYSATFAAGLEALRARDPVAGKVAFERCLELIPEDQASAYNLVCAEALAGNVDAALGWLERAFAWGFGASPDEQDLLTEDEDLAVLREDPRFAAIVGLVAARRSELRAYAAEPLRYVPAALEGKEPLPLLVVLHDYGETKESVIAGPWRAVADALGMVLLAPSGAAGIGSAPADGMGWFTSLTNYAERPWDFERTIDDALRAFRREHVVDPERTVIAGSGQGGTVALHVGLAAPAFWKVALSFEGLPLDTLLTQQLEVALRHDLRLRLLFDTSAAPSEAELAAAVEGLQAGLAATGLDVGCATWTSTDGDVARIDTVLATLGSVLPAGD